MPSDPKRAGQLEKESQEWMQSCNDEQWALQEKRCDVAGSSGTQQSEKTEGGKGEGQTTLEQTEQGLGEDAKKRKRELEGGAPGKHGSHRVQSPKGAF
jgi:hypothetical protein